MLFWNLLRFVNSNQIALMLIELLFYNKVCISLNISWRCVDGKLISLYCVVVNRICICLNLKTKDYRLKTLCTFGGFLPHIRRNAKCHMAENAAADIRERSAAKVPFQWHWGNFPPLPKWRFSGISRAICQSIQREICKICKTCESFAAFTAFHQPYPYLR